MPFIELDLAVDPARQSRPEPLAMADDPPREDGAVSGSVRRRADSPGHHRAPRAEALEPVLRFVRFKGHEPMGGRPPP